MEGQTYLALCNSCPMLNMFGSHKTERDPRVKLSRHWDMGGASAVEKHVTTADEGEPGSKQKLPEDVRAQLAQAGIPRKFAKGETLFLRGDPGDYIVILTGGLVEISVTSLNGRKSVLAHIGAGEMLGEIAVLDGAPRSADVTALRPTDTVLVPRAALLEVISRNPIAALWMIEALCERVRNASDMFETVSMTAASSRLARCLVQLAGKWGSTTSEGTTLSETFSQSELGAFAGVARENVNRLIRTWSADGKVAFDRGNVLILDMEWLEYMAEHEP